MRKIFFQFVIILLALSATTLHTLEPKNIVYMVSDARIPFWQILSKGIIQEAKEQNYNVTILSADNNPKQELKNLFDAIQNKADAIILSPTSSSACAGLLHFTTQAKIPVVIADIGTDQGEYLSYISSDNEDGAYKLGQILGREFEKKGIKDGMVGIIAIPQKRINGQLRTSGFMKAMNEFHISGAGIKQQVDFSYEETYKFTQELLHETPQIQALWLQGSDRYQAALNALKDLNLQTKVLLLTFDAEPVFLELIPNNVILASAMQQPYLIGKKSVQNLAHYFAGEKVIKNEKLSILAISKENLQIELPKIKKYVLGSNE
jgi:ribose transport system substrate-binding protein